MRCLRGGKNTAEIPGSQKDLLDEMMKWGRVPKGRKASQNWYRSSSWVSGIFVLDEIVGILIRSYKPEKDKWECYLQLYDIEGHLIDIGMRLPEVGSSSDTGFSIDSDRKNSFYIIEQIESDPVRYKLYHYGLLPSLGSGVLPHVLRKGEAYGDPPPGVGL